MSESNVPDTGTGSALNVVVTGGAGYLGSVVVYRLLEAGHRVTVVDKLTYGARALMLLRGNNHFQLVRGDVRNDADVTRVFDGADAVVHLAAIVGEPACALDEQQARAINLNGTTNALKLARRCGVKWFIFSSTCSNYGITSSNTFADESSTLQPLSEYARSKIAAEQAVIAADGSLSTLVFRFATLCGLSPRMRFDLLVNEIARSVAFDQPIDIFAPLAWRPFLHVRDAANHIAAALDYAVRGLSFGGHTYNVVGENYQKCGLVELVHKHFPGCEIRITDRQPDLRDYRVSSQRIRDELGLRPELSVEDAFLEVVGAVKMGVFDRPFSREYGEVPEDASRLYA